MKQNRIVEETIRTYPPNALIPAGRLFSERLAGTVSEAAYYKTLERMSRSGELAKIAKGVYYLPKTGAFGAVPLSEKEIIDAYTKNETGTVIGYSLYNQLGLTTQIGKRTEILSSALDAQTKTIRNVYIRYSPLHFSEDVANMVHALEVLQNLGEIQDLRYPALLSYFHTIAERFDQQVFDTVISRQKYAKSTIAFLREILNSYGIRNDLDRRLSSLSAYRYPRMEELYAAAQIPQ